MDRNTAFAFALSMLVFAGYTMYQTERRAEYALQQEALQAQEAAEEEQESQETKEAQDAEAVQEDEAPDTDSEGPSKEDE